MNNTIVRTFARPSMNSIFQDLFLNDKFSGGHSLKNITPATNIRETSEAFLIDMAIPGIAKSAISIDLEKDTLTVSFERKEENTEHGKFIRREFMHESFKRSFRLPVNINRESISASCEHGILTITLPFVVEAEQMVKKQIAVS